jgi:hypothetical protein
MRIGALPLLSIFMRKLKFILACIPALVLAQERVKSEADAILDEFFPIDSLTIESMVLDLKKQDFLYINTLYNTKTLFSGRDFGVEQYSFFPAISYIDSNNFFLNVGSGYYSEVDPQWDFITFSGGYSNHLNKKKSIVATAAYSYTTFTEDVADLNNQRVSLSLSYRAKWFRNALSGGYLFGGNRSSYLSNNTYFNIDLLASKSLDISIEPRVGIFWGNQTITELVRIGFFQFQEVSTDVFQLLNTEVSIPIEFDFGKWDFEIDYTYAMPNALPGEEKPSNNGYFSISLGYLIGL